MSSDIQTMSTSVVSWLSWNLKLYFSFVIVTSSFSCLEVKSISETPHDIVIKFAHKRIFVSVRGPTHAFNINWAETLNIDLGSLCIYIRCIIETLNFKLSLPELTMKKRKCCSNFWACEWNPMIEPFKRNFLGCTFALVLFVFQLFTKWNSST